MFDVWNWQIPMRIKLFCWLVFENRILIGIICQKEVFMVQVDVCCVERGRNR
jgi:hypothetical protein